MNPYLTHQELLAIVDTIDPIAYAKTRNHLSGAVTRLSPYITRGVLTLPEIRDRLSTRYGAHTLEKLLQELTWREYWQQVWFAKGEDIFKDMRFSRDDIQHQNLVEAIVEGRSGIAVLDESVRELYETGYMHNHARMWVAMLACNVAKADWYDMSRWLYYHLLDGDLASNMLSWQWVAGTNASKQYVANQAVINACSTSRQQNTYLDIDRELVGTGPIPPILQTEKEFSYTMEYPASDDYDRTAATVFLYSPWTLSPVWRSEEVGERILLIEPWWFDTFPVSPKVRDFIIAVARTHIPNIKVVVKNADELGFASHTTIHHRSYPTHDNWPGVADPAPRLFPHVTGYYPSFFKFWQACQKRPR